MHKHDMINSCSESLCINRFDQETDKLLNLWTYLFINLYMYTYSVTMAKGAHGCSSSPTFACNLTCNHKKRSTIMLYSQGLFISAVMMCS